MAIDKKIGAANSASTDDKLTPPAPGAEQTTPTAPLPPEPTAPTPTAASTVPDLGTLAASINALLGVIEQEKKDRNVQTQQILATIQAQAETVQELQAELEAVADKGRLGDWEKKALGKDPKQKVFKLQTYNGKVVVAWTAMKTNIVYKNQAGAIVENQTTELIYADGSREEVQYAAWQAGRMPLDCILESKEEQSDGKVIFHLVDQKNNKYEVDVTFVN